MISTLFMVCSLFGKLQVVTGLFDSSNYQVLSDTSRATEGFSYFESKCRGELSLEMVHLV